MTITAVGYVLAVAIVVIGGVLAGRANDRMTRLLVLAGAVAAAVVVGWFSWLAGTSA